MKILNQLDYTNNDYFSRNIDVKVIELIKQSKTLSEISNTDKNPNSRFENIDLEYKYKHNHYEKVQLNKIHFNYETFPQKYIEDAKISHYNREFRTSNIKDIKYKDINSLNNINSAYNDFTSFSQLNSTSETENLYKNSKNSNLNSETFKMTKKEKDRKEDPNIENSFSTKMIFSNPNFKQSSKFFTNGINIENRKESINNNLKFSTIKKYEQNLLNLSNQNTFTINESKIFENKDDKVSKTIDNFIKRNHASNNKYVISQAYHTDQKYIDHKNSNECYNCKLKEKINKKFDFQFKEKFKIYDDVVNDLILEVKNLMKKGSLSNLTKAYNLINQYFKCKLGAKEVQHSDLFYLLGEVCRELKFEKEAEMNLLEALRFEDHPSKCYLSLGLLYLNDHNQYDVSIKMLKKYNSLVKNSHSAYYSLSTAYFKIKDYRSALKNIEIALKSLGINSSDINTNYDYVGKYIRLKQEIESLLNEE